TQAAGITPDLEELLLQMHRFWTIYLGDFRVFIIKQPFYLVLYKTGNSSFRKSDKIIIQNLCICHKIHSRFGMRQNPRDIGGYWSIR
ncbi:MAG: hypothetical protein FWD72_04395, partial [Eggerthellaceae bacterium]|nr:hypothetical protein [Eggerthellaceae bacterium]